MEGYIIKNLTIKPKIHNKYKKYNLDSQKNICINIVHKGTYKR